MRGGDNNFIAEDHPDRHNVVDSCVSTQGPTFDRDSSCVICLEDMKENEMMVTHGLPGNGECNHAFHALCFEELVTSAGLADEIDPAGANSTEPDKQFAKCPICRGELYPYTKQGCELPPALAEDREHVRFQSVHERVADQPSSVIPSASFSARNFLR